MRLFVDNQGNIVFAFSPLIFDTHPPFTERIKYLRPFVTCNSSASYSLKAFIKQTEDDNFENINLSSEEILEIQREIDKSSKRDRYQRLEKIEILPYLDYANIRLFFSGERPYFIPFDFEPALLSGNVSCLIEILRVILNQPSKNFYHKSIPEHMPIPSSDTLKEEYSGVTHRCVFMVKDQHTKNSIYIIYPEEEPLSLEYHQLASV